MDEYGNFDPTSVENENYYNPKQHNSILDEVNSLDKGYHTFQRVINKDGYPKRVKIAVYTSYGLGTRIRDAESGMFYTDIVGSLNEHLFFKIALKTGEIPGNGPTTLFYLTPQHCMSHLHDTISPEIITKWESKRDARLKAKQFETPLRNKINLIK
jgi:hypothetical protein